MNSTINWAAMQNPNQLYDSVLGSGVPTNYAQQRSNYIGPYNGSLYNQSGADYVSQAPVQGLVNNGINWMDYGKAGIGAVNGLAQAYNAFTTSDIARKQFEVNRQVAMANLQGQQQAFNNQVATQANNMYSGYAQERVANGDNRSRTEYQSDYLSTRGV